MISHPRRIAAPAAVLSAALLAGCVATTPQPDDASAHGPAAVIRVDQVGYGTGEAKRAIVLADAAALRGAEVRVVAADGTVVQHGELGPDAGAWNDDYDTTRTVDFSSLTDPGDYTVRVTGPEVDVTSPTFAVAPLADLLHPLADLNVRFFQAQRDGADVIPAVLDRQPSHLLDEQATVYDTPHYADEGATLLDDRLTPTGSATVDVSGGWFDAGDFLKFTGTTAYSTAEMLLALRHPSTSDADLDAEADAGIAWLEKMWDEQTGTLFLQVGIGNGNESVRTDHDVWRLPEADDLSDARPGDPDFTIAHRPVFAANEPGAPIPPSVAGRVAAAFALQAQRRTADGDDDGAVAALGRAAVVYAQADTDPQGSAALATAVPTEFYPEDSWADDLEFAAVELTVAGRALGDARAAGWQADAAAWAQRYIESDSTGTLGVADVSALAHADLIALDDPSAPELIADLRRQLDAGVEHATHDLFGAGASTLDFDAVPFTFGLIATAALYETATGDTSYRRFATEQRGWALGMNAWGSSFMIGAGTTYPQCPEHQVANLTEGDDELLGAVVNGPNEASKLDDLNRFETMEPCAADGADGVPYAAFDGQGSRYLDDVGAWQTVEPSIDFTSTALLAFTLTAALPAG